MAVFTRRQEPLATVANDRNATRHACHSWVEAALRWCRGARLNRGSDADMQDTDNPRFWAGRRDAGPLGEQKQSLNERALAGSFQCKPEMSIQCALRPQKHHTWQLRQDRRQDARNIAVKAGLLMLVFGNRFIPKGEVRWCWCLTRLKNSISKMIASCLFCEASVSNSSPDKRLR